MDAVVFERSLEKGVQHVEAGLVGRVQGALDRHAAESAHADPAVVVAAPRAAPMLQLNQLIAGLLDEDLDYVLIGEEVAALDGVEGMGVEAVVFVAYHRCGAALG